MPKYNDITCEQCGTTGKFRGQRFCSNSCRTTFSNIHDNPASRPEAKQKIAAAAKSGNRQAQLMTPAAREKAVAKIAQTMTGRKQAPEVVAKRSEAWKLTAMRHGGMTPSHRAQLEQVQSLTKGPGHPNWKGGITPERKRDYKSAAYKAFRKAVMERDDFTCRECRRRGGRLEVHHLYVAASQCNGPLRFLKFHPANGLTLCLACHNQTKTTRPDLTPVDTAQLPKHILDMLSGEVGPELEPSALA
jgi:hypothetical protein